MLASAKYIVHATFEAQEHHPPKKTQSIYFICVKKKDTIVEWMLWTLMEKSKNFRNMEVK